MGVLLLIVAVPDQFPEILMKSGPPELVALSPLLQAESVSAKARTTNNSST
ncbi:MAG: hypothetical protein DHS20C01_06320 [marine bacterium B5-7]|nr:MAG: hypothetical protein DHS20C01_06320 [marine bacterium B5-7]